MYSGSLQDINCWLYEDYNKIKLPGCSWAIHCIPKSKIICISKMTTLDNACVILTKKILFTNTSIKIYIFDHQIDNTVLFKEGPLKNIADVEKVLAIFEDISICLGAMDIKKMPTNKSQHYIKDAYLNVWRHNKCTYMMDSLSGTSKNQNKCEYCLKIRKTIYYYQRKTNLNITKVQLLRKKLNKQRKKETRLKEKYKDLCKTLKETKIKMKALNENSLIEKIKDIPNISSSQKFLIEECVRICKYKQKTSRRYASEWLVLCLLLHIRSPAGYDFLRKNEILPLPVVSTIRKYLSKINLKCGLDTNFFEAFKLKMKQKSDIFKQGILVFDEMQVRESVNLNVKNMKLIGLQDFGENHTESTKSTDKRANHALVFMFSSLYI